MSDSILPYEPVAFGATSGLIHGGTGRTGVVICNDWGFEGTCARRSLRILADRLAGLGYPVLRFDYPGTGESLALPLDVDGLQIFDDTLAQASDILRIRRGVTKVISVGLGFGAVLVGNAIARQDDQAAGAVLLAPVLNGRAYLRELQLRASMIAEVTGVRPEPLPDGAFSVAGFVMSPGLAAEIKSLRISAEQFPRDLPILVLNRGGRENEADFASKIAARNPVNRTAVFWGYDDLMTDPTAAKVPQPDFTAVAEWIRTQFPPEAASAAQSGPIAPAMTGAGFVETIHIIGRENQMVGTWCCPERGQTGPAVVFFNAGGTPRSGWADHVRTTARRLAQDGIASLRIDVSDVGDSHPASQGDEIVHYSECQLHDISDALDFVETRGVRSVVAAGTCSGAYLALRGAISDQRIAGIVAVNLQRFLWDRREDVEQALRFDHTDTGAYARKLLDASKLKKLFTGQVSALSLSRFLATRALRSLESRTAPYLFGLSPSSRIYRRVNSELRDLRDRNVRIDFLFSVGDVGIPHMERVLGKDGRNAAAFPNLDLTFIPDADHNLTPAPAQEIYYAKIKSAVERISGSDGARA
ncbi:alpha/beta fold hydrolase [Roseibium sp.]|uniref:alpha/beta fold hydrolase n=1 Tax=Roseibium sp. TaxID=1936156 RepID=UPI003A98269A